MCSKRIKIPPGINNAAITLGADHTGLYGEPVATRLASQS